MIELATMALGKLFGMGETWVEAKQERATAKVKAKIALDDAKTKSKITILEKDAEACNDIDLITVKNMRYTWSDELFKIIMLAPFVLMFIPYFHPYVKGGFEFFKDAPEWWQYIIYGIAVSELGLRRIFMRLFDTIMTVRTGKRNG